MNYFAHSAKDGHVGQSYTAHVCGAMSLAKQYAEEAGAYACLDGAVLYQLVREATDYHDLGKLHKENQKVLSGETSARVLPVNHVDAGAAHWLKESQCSPLAAMAIQAHHIGFPALPAEYNKEDRMFRDLEIAGATDKSLLDFEAIHKRLIPQQNCIQAEKTVSGDRSVFLRILLSCVADADHTDTARHYGKYPLNEIHITLKPKERLARLDACVAQLQRKNGLSERNTLRREVYQSCRNADMKASICSCDSPVGSGKTTAIMAHLLAQAQKRGLRRIFVILPYTNIIQQSVEIYREMLSLPGENPNEVVAELHHRADFESEDARHFTALWRAPIIVTTAVAFFETLASNSTATLRRLHELPGSAVFVDESHAALPAFLLPLAWKWIRILSDEWSCYWVLASGSLSRFWTISEIAGKTGKRDIPEIVSKPVHDKLFTYENNRIIYRKDLVPKSTDALAEWIASFAGPRLVILNTVQSAAVLAECLAEKFGREKVEHLSTALTPNDRESSLKKIKTRLKCLADTDWTLVATSCVEAGINISFKTGFRELCSLSSLLQTAGRINRGGASAGSELWTFCIKEDGMLKLNPGLKQAGVVLKEYLEKNIQITPRLTTQSISDEIALYGLNGKYKKLMDYEDVQDFPGVEKLFKVIESDTKLAIVDAGLAERMRYGKIDWNELQRASVRIAKYKLDELEIKPIMDDIYFWNLEYDSLLGYMSGIIKLRKLSGQSIII